MNILKIIIIFIIYFPFFLYGQEVANYSDFKNYQFNEFHISLKIPCSYYDDSTAFNRVNADGSEEMNITYYNTLDFHNAPFAVILHALKGNHKAKHDARYIADNMLMNSLKQKFPSLTSESQEIICSGIPSCVVTAHYYDSDNDINVNMKMVVIVKDNFLWTVTIHYENIDSKYPAALNEEISRLPLIANDVINTIQIKFDEKNTGKPIKNSKFKNTEHSGNSIVAESEETNSQITILPMVTPSKLPTKVKVDSLGNVFVLDPQIGLTKCDSNGKYLWRWESNGWASDFAIDSKNNTYVICQKSKVTSIQKIDPDGNVTNLGPIGVDPDYLKNASAIAVDSSGNVYVAGTKIIKFSSNGNFLKDWGEMGRGDPQFGLIGDLFLDSLGNYYVSNSVVIGSVNDNIENSIKKFDPDGSFLSKWTVEDIVLGMAFDTSGNVYVCFYKKGRTDNAIQINDFDANGKLLKKWDANKLFKTKSNDIRGLAIDSSDNFYTLDRENNCVLKICNSSIQSPKVQPVVEQNHANSQMTVIATTTPSVKPKPWSNELIEGNKALKAKDYSGAVKRYQKAADQGDALGENNLGDLYCDGNGVPQDYQVAMMWYRKAADQGYANAEVGIGDLYFKGFGVTQDYQEAMRWFQKAADQGEPDAENNLGLLYKNGFGVQQDYKEAMMWYQKAVSHGSADAENNLEILKRQMTQ
jgi:tetratricopeptide (TPR) repeat protein